MSQSAPAEPQDAVIIKYTRERELPISAIGSVFLHLSILTIILLGLLASMFNRERPPVKFEIVDLVGTPGGGADGKDEGARPGALVGPDQPTAIENVQRLPLPNLGGNEPPKVTRPPEKPIINETFDPLAAAEKRVDNLPTLPDLKGMLKGLKSGDIHESGTAGRGPGDGPGTGPNKGPGHGTPGKLNPTIKEKRQLRWTLLFRISNPANYLDQLRRMGAILGVQYHDKSIKLITNLQVRPAKLESGDRVPDRIFWMDDNVESVRSIAAELGIGTVPWRLIAFFPDRIEQELLRKEKAYGKAYGRDTEDDIKETVFRVDDEYGQISLSVLRQEGVKK